MAKRTINKREDSRNSINNSQHGVNKNNGNTKSGKKVSGKKVEEEIR